MFIPKKIRGRTYWYFQLSSNEGRTQKYVGPETPELLERIAHHKEARDDERERRALVSTLVRSFGLSRPIPEIGNVIAALAKAGVFRLRGILVGTVAYQSYSAMLGTKLPNPTLQTGDQFKTVSIAIEDTTPPVLDTLKEVDKTFRPAPHINNERQATSYQTKSKWRVDFLTPNEGPDTDAPQPLPALQTDAEPLRFLDFLIHEPEPAVLLHDAGIYAFVPAPQRYAVHKLIVSRRRPEGTAKRDKDTPQAEALLELLAQKRPYELKSAWSEAYERGPKWRRLLVEGTSQLTSRVRDITLKVSDHRRSLLPGLDLTFNNPPAHYDFDRDVVTFAGEALDNPVQCAISRGALDDHFGTNGLDKAQRLEKFLENSSAIEELARTKYLTWPVEEPDKVLIKTKDVAQLRKSASKVT